MKKNNIPFVSFIIPVYNAGSFLERCLQSIRKQEYPQNKYEILVVDGGSTDNTKVIAGNYNAIIINNPKIDQESGKSLGIRRSKGSILVLMDADNEIVKNDWLNRMIKPLQRDPNLFGVESQYFYRKNDNIFNTYCMLLHIADPFSRMLTGKLIKRKKKGYEEYTIPKGQSYPLGANGFLWNKRIIDKVGLKGSMFEESNYSYFVMEKGFRTFARVPGYGIYHYHIRSLGDFIKKRLKIGNKFINRKLEKKRTWLEGVSSTRFIFSVIYSITFVGPFLEGIYHFCRSGQKAWLLHPLMSFLSVTIYAIVFVRRRLNF